MSENISDQTFTSVVAGEEEGYVVFAQYGAAALTVDLEEVINELAARLRTLEATTARQEREIAALHGIIDIQGTINSVVEGRLTDMDGEIEALSAQNTITHDPIQLPHGPHCTAFLQNKER